MIPSYAPSVPDWQRLVANALNPIIRRFRGSGTYQKEDFPGFTFVPDLENINYVDSLGTTADPVTDVDPVVAISKNSLVGDLAGGVNPALTVQHNHYGTTGESSAVGAYIETVVRAGGSSVFGEALRAHCFVPDGIVGKANTALFFAYNGGTGLNTVPVESEVRRGTASDCPLPRNYVITSQLDAGFCATAHTVDGTVGATGGKPMAAFYVNPFGSKPFHAALWVPASVVGGATVTQSVVSCQQTGLVYGIDLAKGSYSTAAVALPNNSKVTAYNAAGTTELDVLRLDGSNILQLGTDVSGYGVKVAALGNYASDAAASAGGVAVGGLYRNGSNICVRVT